MPCTRQRATFCASPFDERRRPAASSSREVTPFTLLRTHFQRLPRCCVTEKYFSITPTMTRPSEATARLQVVGATCGLADRMVASTWHYGRLGFDRFSRSTHVCRLTVDAGPQGDQRQRWLEKRVSHLNTTTQMMSHTYRCAAESIQSCLDRGFSTQHAISHHAHPRDHSCGCESCPATGSFDPMMIIALEWLIWVRWWVPWPRSLKIECL